MVNTIEDVFHPKMSCSLSLSVIKKKLILDRRNRTNSQ